jgi:hypothetical protein
MAADLGTLTPVVDGIWIASAPVRIVGTHLTSTMTVVRLADASLLVHSPVSLTPERRAAVEALGDVRHLYAPNTFHHLSIGDWSAAFPRARVHAPAALAKKRPELRIDRTHGSGPEPAFTAELDELPIDGFYLHETVLFHRPSRTLIVTDLVHNVGRPDDGWTKFYTKMMGFYDQLALSKALRWTSFSDKKKARRSVDALLALPFSNLIVGHGAPVSSSARAALQAAYAWLPAIA